MHQLDKNCEAMISYIRTKLNSLEILSLALLVFQKGFYFSHFKEENAMSQGMFTFTVVRS